MKMKYLAGVMLLMAGLCSLSSCSDDDDYSAATGNVISTIETGDASVTAISAVVSGKVLDLSKQDAGAYAVGVVYGTNPDPTTAGSKQPGVIDAATIAAAQFESESAGRLPNSQESIGMGR